MLSAVVTALPRLTSAKVLIPALCLLTTLSQPTRHPKSVARISLIATAISLVPSKNSSIVIPFIKLTPFPIK